MNNQYTAKLRSFRESDVTAVRCLIHDTIDSCYSSVYPPQAVQFFKTFHSESKIKKRNLKGHMVVVEREGDIIATGTLIADDITGVFVHPDCQHQGHGRRIMLNLESQALQSGYNETTLSVSLPSRVFYEDLGYEVIEDCSIEVGGEEHLEFWKAKKNLPKQNKSQQNKSQPEH